MFRDGVRRLTLHPEMEWEEALRLLEILSIRYTGVRQNEDDIVTLLWKAGFAHIEVAAVEGFVPEEEDGPSGPPGRRADVRVEVPGDWDLPLRPLGETTPVQRREIAEADRERLRAEEDPSALPGNVVRVVLEMLEAAADPTDPTSLDDLAPFIGEARDFLVSEGQLRALTALVRGLKQAGHIDPVRMATLLASFSDKRALDTLIHAVRTDVTTTPAELEALLDLLPADHVGHLVDLLAEERAQSLGGLVRPLLERYAPRGPEELLARLETAEGEWACELLRVCAVALPARAVEAATALAFRPEDAVALQALEILGEAPKDPAVGRTLVKMLESPSADVRLKVAEALARRKEHAAFGALVRFVERRARHSLTLREAETYGQGLARLQPTGALSLFKAWIQEKGLLARLIPSARDKHLRWAAVAGLAELPGEEPQILLEDVAAKADDALRAHCDAALERRRARGAGD
jgi:hypothetical protein